MLTRVVKNPTPGAPNPSAPKKAKKSAATVTPAPPRLAIDRPLSPKVCHPKALNAMLLKSCVGENVGTEADVKSALAAFALKSDENAGKLVTTTNHCNKCVRLENDFIQSLVGPQKEEVGEVLTELVTFVHGAKPIPRFFLACAGDKTLEKIRAVSKAVFFWLKN